MIRKRGDSVIEIVEVRIKIVKIIVDCWGEGVKIYLCMYMCIIWNEN